MTWGDMTHEQQAQALIHTIMASPVTGLRLDWYLGLLNGPAPQTIARDIALEVLRLIEELSDEI